MAFILICLSIKANAIINPFVIGSEYQGMSYQEMLGAVMMQQNAHNRAAQTLEGYLTQAMKCIENKEYDLAKKWIERGYELNKRFDFNLCNPKFIKELYDYCNQKIEEQKYNSGY